MEDVKAFVKEYVGKLHPSKLGLKGDRIDSVEVTEHYSRPSDRNYSFTANGSPFLFRTSWAGSSQKRFEVEYPKLEALAKYDVAPKPFILNTYQLGTPFMITSLFQGKHLEKNEVGIYSPSIADSLMELKNVPAEQVKTEYIFKKDAVDSCYDVPFELLDKATSKLKEYQMTLGDNALTKTLTKLIPKAKEYTEKRKDLFSNTSTGLVHGHLDHRNILRDPKGTIKFGNWHSARIADPALDLLSLLKLNYLKHEHLKNVLASYEGDKGIEQRVHFYSELAMITDVLDNALEVYRGKTTLSKKSESEIASNEAKYEKSLESLVQSDLASESHIKTSHLPKKKDQFTEPAGPSLWDKVKGYVGKIDPFLIPEKVIGAVALTALLGGGFLYYQYHNKKNFDNFLQTLKETTETRRTYILDPSPKKLNAFDKKLEEMKKLRNKNAITNIGRYLKKHGWKRVCYNMDLPHIKAPIETCFVGEEKGMIFHKKTRIILAESGEKGILPLDIELKGNEGFIKHITYDSGTQEVVVDLTPIKKNAKTLADKIEFLKANNSLCLKGNDKCNWENQAAYIATNLANGKTFEEKYVNAVINSTLEHETSHNFDDEKGYSPLEGEINAYLSEVIDADTTIVFHRLFQHINSGDEKNLYTKVSRKVLTCLMNKSKRKRPIDLLHLSKQNRSKFGKQCKRRLLKR